MGNFYSLVFLDIILFSFSMLQMAIFFFEHTFALFLKNSKRDSKYIPRAQILKIRSADSWVSALVCLGCHNRIPQTWWLKQYNVFSQYSGHQKFNSKVLVVLVSGETFSFWFAKDHLFTVSSHGLSSVSILLVSLPFPIRTLILLD